MANYTFRMPDIGEGIVDAEVVEWHVQVGDSVEEDVPLVNVMTDKATVEITSPVRGTVVATGCAAGERVMIGDGLVEFDTGSGVAVNAEDTPIVSAHEVDVLLDNATERDHDSASPVESRPNVDQPAAPQRRLNTPPSELKPRIRVLAANDATEASRAILASPAVRRRARELGIELSQVFGTGPDGRVLRSDLEAGARERDADERRRADAASGADEHKQYPMALDSGTETQDPRDEVHANRATPAAPADTAKGPLPVMENEPSQPTERSLLGLRRIIAQRLGESARSIPHFSYVDEVDVTELEALRQHLNAERDATLPRLSLLHFVLLGVCRTVAHWPQANAHYDDARNVLTCHPDVHLGVATMTDEGLMVPVVHMAHTLSLDALAVTVNALAADARTKRLPREKLSGSTITVTSLGALAGIVTTPIINRPETAIIGPNRMIKKLVLHENQVVQRRVMNISSSFDHRVVDGHDAASLIQHLKSLLEHPATLFMSS